MSDTSAPLDDGVPADRRTSTAARTLHLLLTPAPGRLRNALILVAGVLIIVTVWEVFRIPNITIACYIVLFISRDVRTTTIASAKGIAVLGVVAVLGDVLLMAASLSEPGLRFALIVLGTFGALFMSRAARSGIPFFAVGFLLVDGLTSGDSVNEVGFQPYTIGNAPSTALPTLLFLPSEEALLHALLWPMLAVVAAPAVVIVLNLAFGRDPAVLLRQGIAARLRACAGFCEDRPGAAARLETIARRGPAELLTLAGLSQQDHGARAEPADVATAEVRGTTRAMLALLATRMLDRLPDGPGPHPRPWKDAAARRCRALADGGDAPSLEEGTDGLGTDRLGTEVSAGLDAVAEARRRRADPPAGPKPEKPGFWSDDPFSAANVQFALKVTLAVTICYTIENALDWPGIGTCVVTCFFVALGSLGESVHKMTLRICGCLVGSAFGIGSVILFMPIMTDLPELLGLVGAVVFVAAWVACGGERISYAGWQMAIAYFVVVLQGFGPVTDMQTAKDRIIGILLGLTVSFLVMATLWPVRVERLAATSLADALDGLARLLRRPEEPEKVREGFAVAVGRALSLLGDGGFEAVDPDAAAVHEELAVRVQAMVIPVALLAHSEARAYPDAVAAWMDEGARRLRAFDACLPPPPDRPEAPAGEAAAYALMDQELAALPRPDRAPRIASVARSVPQAGIRSTR